MASLIYEPLRVSGIGMWSRTNEGQWALDKMHVQSYETLEDESLSLTVEKLRDLNVKWPANALDRFQAEREGKA